ncbi:MAG: hypothetical protein KF855_03350 [Acidobacteria bacterium]|nr:hypothetical protein [Acidobacteriota bacterium]
MKYYAFDNSGALLETEPEPDDSPKSYLVSWRAFQRVKPFLPARVPFDGIVLQRVVEDDPPEELFNSFVFEPKALAEASQNDSIEGFTEFVPTVPTTQGLENTTTDFTLRGLAGLTEKPTHEAQLIAPPSFNWYQRLWLKIDAMARRLLFK